MLSYALKQHLASPDVTKSHKFPYAATVSWRTLDPLQQPVTDILGVPHVGREGMR